MPLELPAVKLAGIAPEIVLSATALALLLIHAFVQREGWYLPLIATFGLGLAMRLAVGAGDPPASHFSGAIASDGFASFSKVAIAVFGLLTVWLARATVVRRGLEESEFYALVLFATAGMMLMAAAADLIVMFLALEMFSIALYVLVGFRADSSDGQESSMKYFLLGAFSSAFFLLGIALVYGATGSTTLGPGGQQNIIEALNAAPAGGASLLILGTAMLIVGLGFKVAAVPFHMWTPDAYQGAATAVTGFMAAGSKFAGFAAMLRLLDGTLFSIRWDWRPLLVAIAVATMVVGSVLAVVQENVKRMLAYSSIAHAGFVLTGIVAANDRGVAGTLFYLTVYGLTVLGAFAVVAILAGPDDSRVRLADYRGLFAANPLLAGALTLFLLSLAGVPLTSGFVGKLVVFAAAIESGYVWLIAIGALASAVAAFFYLRVLVVMYMQEPDAETASVRANPLAGGVVAVTAAATLILGIFWGPLIRAAENATFFAGV
ncbi:MAG: NADH-quinone oxidoreductase subunit N [Actinomycetota bacterium]